ncbi:Uncharacterised protein [uncultured archaeon]|nr:Uncharacterised protein [uncultured archaeon]
MIEIHYVLAVVHLRCYLLVGSLLPAQILYHLACIIQVASYAYASWALGEIQRRRGYDQRLVLPLTGEPVIGHGSGHELRCIVDAQGHYPSHSHFAVVLIIHL